MTESQSDTGTSSLAAPTSTIHEAEPVPGPSGGVWYGAEIDFDTAVARRRSGLDVIVRGDDGDANRRLAYRIEAAVGPPSRPQPPERRAGPALQGLTMLQGFSTICKDFPADAGECVKVNLSDAVGRD